jgi:SAM-dependent methyltransferase
MESASEGDRIERKTDISLMRAQLAQLPLDRASKVLDLGCAAGTTTRLIASLLPSDGRVVGVDASANRLAQALAHPDHSARIQYVAGIAEQLPAGPSEFDICWARFLFEYLPNPAIVMSELVRVVRPGGIVCVSDIDGNCVWHHPIELALEREIGEALAALAEAGFDPFAGRKLFSLFHRAGLEHMTVDVQPYHLVAGSISPSQRHLWLIKLDTVQSSLQQLGWPEHRAADVSRRFLAHLDDPATLTYSTLVTVTGVKRV